MDHAGNLILVLRFYGNTIPVIAHGNDGVLEIGAAGASQHARKLGMDFLIGKPHAPADMLQCRAGIVADLVLR